MRWILLFLAVLFCFTNDGIAEEPTTPATTTSEPSDVAETPSSPIETAGPGQPETGGQEPSSPGGPSGPLGPVPSGAKAGEGPTAPFAPAWPGQKDSMPSVAEIFFAAGTVSADSKALYVILDRLLMHYSLPNLDLKRKVELDIAVAPVNPSISISKDGKYIYVIYNRILYQIDAAEFKIEKRVIITP